MTQRHPLILSLKAASACKLLLVYYWHAASTVSVGNLSTIAQIISKIVLMIVV